MKVAAHSERFNPGRLSERIDPPVDQSVCESEDATSENKSGNYLTLRFDVPPKLLTHVECRRCGKPISGDQPCCPYCAAPLGVDSHSNPALKSYAARSLLAAESATAVTRVLIFYLLLLAMHLAGHLMVRELVNEHIRIRPNADPRLDITICGELIGAAILLVALAKIPLPPPIAASSLKQRRIGACVSPFILAVCLAMNFGYHGLMRNYVQYPFQLRGDSHWPIGWSIVLVCIQPGIVEELFFRYLTLGTLARVMSVREAVCVSALMFGMAHSGVPMSIPILTIVGVGLGIVRVWSGSMLLPILLHSLHNAVVLYLETAK